MNRYRAHRSAAAVVALTFGSWSAAGAQESRQVRPEVEQLQQSVSEKLQAAADALGLSPEQRDKIREANRQFEARRQALRDQRESLLQSDLKAIDAILTPEQRTKVKDFLSERADSARDAAQGAIAWLRENVRADTLAQKLQAAAERLGLSADQQKQVRDRVAASAEKYREQRKARRDLVEAEFKTITETLTPYQREQARRAIEYRLATAAVAQSVADRLTAAADKLGLSPEQRQKIVDAYGRFDAKYEALADERRDLLRSELKAVSEALTPEQRQKVQDYLSDRVILVDVQVDPNDPQATALLKETIAERFEAAADKLGLSADQRAKIKAGYAPFAEKFRAQREKREALRKEELQAMSDILTPEQRQKVQNFFADRMTNP